MVRVSRRLTYTILSMSLLTVMAGAAIAPALGAIKAHFADAPAILIQLVVSMPALFIIITNLFFHKISSLMKTRTIAIVGLVMYIVFGTCAMFAKSIGVLLVMRALLGVSVGMIMPLSTGLLAYYYPPEAQAYLMGLSAAMNQMGGVVATLLAGLLANIQWNYGFLVYLMGLVALVLVFIFLPNEQLSSKGSKLSAATLVRFHPSVIGMLLLMIIFFIYPTNFAISAYETASLSPNVITFIMVGLDVVAFFVGLLFGRLMKWFRVEIKYFAPIFFGFGYSFLAFGAGLWSLLLGSAFIGIANGVGVPYLNTIASIKGGKESATTVMPLLSAALYLGQFVSPLIVMPLGRVIFGANDVQAPWKVGIIFCFLFLIQVFSTRHFQSLPPEKKKKS
jgi:MFS family permease